MHGRVVAIAALLVLAFAGVVVRVAVVGALSAVVDTPLAPELVVAPARLVQGREPDRAADPTRGNASRVAPAVASIASESRPVEGGSMLSASRDGDRIRHAASQGPTAAPSAAGIRALWRRAADAGAPDSALVRFEDIVRVLPREADAHALATRALDDLRALRDRLDGRADTRAAAADTASPDHRGRIEEAAADLRYADDARVVSGALQLLAQSRVDAAADALLDAGVLVEPRHREQRILALWRMAADAVETTRGPLLRDALEDFADSSDPVESGLATRALDDLARLDED